MAMAFASPRIATFLSSSSSSSTFHSNSHSFLSLRSLPSTCPIIFPSKKFIFFGNPFQRNNRLAPIILPAAAAQDVIPSEAATVDAADQLVSNTDDGVFMVVSSLLFVAFVGLTLITIGVIYLAVTDFLQKREKDKFDKEEEAANKSKKKKKKKVGLGKGMAGPRGFGQKPVEYDDDDD